MIGMMQEWPLTVDRILSHAAERHGAREIVWREAGEFYQSSYRDLAAHARQISHGLVEMGLSRGDRVATLAWNDARHIEIWYGAMGIGCVCHTLNPRFHPEQLAWIITHAGDRVIFVAPDLIELLNEALARVEGPRPSIIVLGGGVIGQDVGMTSEAWLSGRPESEQAGAPRWGGFAETTACGLCYTSGTTGDPKGVLYSHRSNVLHSLITLQSDVFGLSAGDVVMPIVPLFHANAWGLVFSAPAVGAKLALPGRALDAASIHNMIMSQGVTFAAGVPTIWQALLHHVRETGQSLGPLKRIVVGGAPCSEAMVREFHGLGVELRHAWGMTEVSPLGTSSTPPGWMADRPFEEQLGFRMKQGRPPFGVDIKLLNDAGHRIAEDGVAPGRLMVRGPAVVSAYFGSNSSILDDEDFFDTGDIATIDKDGGMLITDRAKDIIKSGGEWISSLAIETIAASHRNARSVAVIGIPDPKWDERPLLLVQPYEPDDTIIREIHDLLHAKIPKWWIPQILMIDDMPIGSTGKVDKKKLRELFVKN